MQISSLFAWQELERVRQAAQNHTFSIGTKIDAAAFHLARTGETLKVPLLSPGQYEGDPQAKKEMYFAPEPPTKPGQTVLFESSTGRACTAIGKYFGVPRSFCKTSVKREAADCFTVYGSCR